MWGRLAHWLCVSPDLHPSRPYLSVFGLQPQLGSAKHKDGLSAQKHFVLRYLATEGLTATTVCLNDMGKMFLVDKWGWGAALLFGKTLYVIQAYVSSRILQDRNNANPKQLDTFLGFSFLASTATN